MALFLLLPPHDTTRSVSMKRKKNPILTECDDSYSILFYTVIWIENNNTDPFQRHQSTICTTKICCTYQYFLYILIYRFVYKFVFSAVSGRCVVVSLCCTFLTKVLSISTQNGFTLLTWNCVKQFFFSCILVCRLPDLAEVRHYFTENVS